MHDLQFCWWIVAKEFRFHSLAWAEMRLILAVLIRRYYILPDPSTTEETMSPIEHFFVVPK